MSLLSCLLETWLDLMVVMILLKVLRRLVGSRRRLVLVLRVVTVVLVGEQRLATVPTFSLLA